MLSNQQETYNEVNDLFVRAKINLMNHGYSPSYSFLNKSFLKNQASLYINALNDVETKNKKLLDIGCGRGGGLEVYSEYLDLNEIHGCDINEKHISYCIDNNIRGIHYKISNAEKLDYLDNNFDIITSVESSHCYDNIKLFFNEVYRVLVPGGTFSYLDNGYNIKYFLNNSGLFTNIKAYDITKNVMSSCEEDIENFKQIDDKESRDFLVSIAARAYNYYKNYDGSFIKVVCQSQE